jgi:hypothetical protein
MAHRLLVVPIGLPVLAMLFGNASILHTPDTIDLFNRWHRIGIMPVCHGLGSMDGGESDA